VLACIVILRRIGSGCCGVRYGCCPASRPAWWPGRGWTETSVYDADALRYFLLREVVFGQDGSFSFDALVQRYNSDLANGLGNLASRTLTMISRYADDRVPSGVISEDKLLLAKRTGVDTDETTISGFIEHARDQFLQHFEAFAFSKALETAWAAAPLRGALTPSDSPVPVWPHPTGQVRGWHSNRCMLQFRRQHCATRSFTSDSHSLTPCAWEMRACVGLPGRSFWPAPRTNEL